MSTFETVHQERIVGKLVAFDRLIFKGHLTGLMPPGAFVHFLAFLGVLLKDFKGYVSGVTEALKAHAQALAKKAGRPYEYLEGAHTAARGNSKEDRAREIAARDGIREGLIAVFAVVENCRSFIVRGNRETHKLEAVYVPRKCLHFYFYIMDREFGLMHVRLQSWFPFEVQVYVNGREWLGKQLERRGVSFQKSDNKIVEVQDLERAQRLANQFAGRNWVRFLNALARRVNPYFWQVMRSGFGGYYWVVDQCEVATDVLFKDRQTLEEVLPELYEGALENFSAEDVLRFLGRKLRSNLQAEVTTDQKRRVEGYRIKHRVGRNSIKMYDHANVLRIETTLNKASDFRMVRFQEVDGKLVPRTVALTKNVANLKRFFDVASASNERYLEALGAVCSVGANKHAVEELDALCQPHTVDGRHVPRLQPIGPRDCAIFQAALHGEHVVLGFRNKDLAAVLYPEPPASPEEQRRRSAYLSRVIARLRGHGLVTKVKNSHRYRVTSKGFQMMTTSVRVRLRDFPEQYAQAAT